MSNLIKQNTGVGGVKEIFGRDMVKQKFQEMLGKKAQGFITSVLQIVASNELLSKADPISIYNSAAVAATLDLPLNNNLGFSYIVPYSNKQKDGSTKTVAQFQLGYKGFIQLAQRSGQFLTISAKPVYEGQIVEDDTFEGFHFNWKNKLNDNIIGYAAYFKLLNGFEKTLYMSVEELKKHGGKYSKTFKQQYGLWSTDFDTMALKTVIKLLLSKFAPLSIEMQTAVKVDQSVVNDENEDSVTYVDKDVEIVNPHDIAAEKERERILLHIENATTMASLQEVSEYIDISDEEMSSIYNQKFNELNK
jgi:recombination protein RecT